MVIELDVSEGEGGSGGGGGGIPGLLPFVAVKGMNVVELGREERTRRGLEKVVDGLRRRLAGPEMDE